MSEGVRHPLEIFDGGGVTLSCGQDGTLSADELHGFFAGDTRVLSTYRWSVAGHGWRVLSRTREGPSSARWDFQNPKVRVPSGELEEGMLHCRLERKLSGALHDDVTVTSFVPGPVAIRVSLQLDADFSDLFEVSAQRTPPRLGILRIDSGHSVSLLYERSDFRRALHVSFRSGPSAPKFVGAQIVFDLVLEPRAPWRCCLDAVPELGHRRLTFQGDPHAPEHQPEGGELVLKADELLVRPFAQSRRDLERLAMKDGDQRWIAAGAPWFLALFGRDTLVTSLMAGMLGSWHARGALAALGASQAKETDDFRDAQPGKIVHELRHGELAHFHEIPHTPYYGTHDAPALYVLALWNAFRWTGDRELLTRHLDTAIRALAWCEEYGDADRDGLLEYRTRSPQGYRNQSWKDSDDAIVREDGIHAELPIATIELQGYWYAARLAMAEMLDEQGETAGAARERAQAERLRELVEERFWMEDEGCYALALDGNKRLVRSIASNPGHLLWCGLPSPERAARLARRLLAPDMCSGYGLRTLSSEHASYNPLSYQLGSVWPHDTALFAAGLSRYGLFEEAASTFKAVLDAAACFESQRLPELFCGFTRDTGPPVPYERANVPQAWAAAAPILAAQSLLGLVPDAPHGCCYLAPRLPAWLPELELTELVVGDGKLELKLRRDASGTRIEAAQHPSLEIVNETPRAPLWGSPMTFPSG